MRNTASKWTAYWPQKPKIGGYRSCTKPLGNNYAAGADGYILLDARNDFLDTQELP